MKIAIGCDHGGLNLKRTIIEFLSKNEYMVEDCGTYDETSIDYPDIALKVCGMIKEDSAKLGILVCGTGIGMSIAANKIPGIRAAMVSDTFSARMAREHNHAHVLCLGERTIGSALALEIVETFIKSQPQSGRHETRVNKIMNIEIENK